VTNTVGNSNWQALGPYGTTFGGAAVTGTQATVFRDPLDAARAGVGADNRIPSAQFPDGYLQTLDSRRNDRLLSSLKVRLQDRAYQRGVHKGEKLEPRDYYWPPDFGMDTRLVVESRATITPDGLQVVPRPTPMFTVQEQLMADSRTMPRGAAGLMEFRPTADQRVSGLQALSPQWR
jgi:hypothetical protein